MAVKFQIFQSIQFSNQNGLTFKIFALVSCIKSDRFLTTRKSLAFGAARIKKRLCMQEWVNVRSVHSLLCMDIMSIRIYGQVPMEKNCSASVRLVMLYAVSIMQCGAMHCSWTCVT